MKFLWYITEPFSPYTALNDTFEARDCLNLSSDATAPLPVVLETTITEDHFICPNMIPLYTFHCTVNGRDLIWNFNNVRVALYLPNDMHLVGQIESKIIYIDSIPVYNITTALTYVSKPEQSDMFPTCVSLLTVQPLSDSQPMSQILPFTVSCQTFCQDSSRTRVCQFKHYEVAGMFNIIIMDILTYQLYNYIIILYYRHAYM